jgi:RNA polymerase sigma-70 factor (ECF subfamily)
MSARGAASSASRAEASYEQRESVELAFIAALQHLPATQRAVLILRVRAAVRDRVPEQSQQATLRSLGDEGVRELVGRYVSAWERCDIEAFIAMLAEDATFAMPPLRNWYRGRDVIAAWVSRSPMSGEWRWRTQPARANGQIAFGFYAWNATEEAHLAFALNVLTIRGSEVADVTAFIARSAEPRARELFARYPDEPPDAGRVGTMFGRFGLASRLD